MSSATLKQVAELTGKSEATVSLVLNAGHYHRVSAKTRDKILAVAREVGYLPNLKAQALARGKTGTIAVTAIGMTPFYSEYIRRLTHILEKEGYSIFVFEAMLNPNRETQVVQWVRQGMFDGCICLEYNQSNRVAYEPLVQSGIPYAFRGWNAFPDTPEWLLRVDYFPAISELFAHLEDEGWSNLSVIIDGSSYMEEPESFSVRKRIYNSLCAERRLRIDPEAWVEVPFDAENHLHYVYRRFKDVLTRRPDVDGVIVQSASEIPAVYKAASDLGRRVGDDLAVATFDQIPLLDYMSPPVTYICEATDDIARRLANALLAQLSGKAPEPMPLAASRLTIQRSTQRQYTPLRRGL